MNDIMKIVQALENYILFKGKQLLKQLSKRVTKTIENETKEQK